MSLRNPFFQVPRTFSRCFRRQYSGPSPNYAANNPIHLPPTFLARHPPALSSFLRWCLAGAFVGLPGYWILWLGQKVSIPYCIPSFWDGKLILDIGRLDAFQTTLTNERKLELARMTKKRLGKQKKLIF